MGSVYRARDTRLGRFVAIKVLTPGQSDARFLREAQAASSLNHPAIVTIYDIGESFIAMELVDGWNLRQWLQQNPSREKRIDVMSQVAKGLELAHAHGIVHRDIKPENVMVTRSGAAKIVDFGLAKPIEVNKSSTDVMITSRGHVAGTLAYMSPEQLAGEAVDARSDIYSFGLVLRDVFGADDAALGRVIDRCLQRDRLLRYQSMDAVLLDMRPNIARSQAPWIAAIAAAVIAAVVAAIVYRPARPLPNGSIAVLPFQPLGAQPYVADGITDALTTDLARQSGLTVIDRNSSRRYAFDADLHRVAGDLGVRYVLVGSVQPVANSVRVDARLVDTTTDAHVWADHFEHPVSEIFSAESEIVRAVAAKLRPTGVERAVSQPADPRVADLFLRARFFAEDVSWQVQDRSVPLLEQVVQLDPAFLPARIALAEQYQRKAFEPDPDRSWAAKAFVELQKILAQDPTAAAAYAIRSNLHWNKTYGFAHEEAVGDLNRAIQLDPNLVVGYNSRGSILMHVGLLDEAMRDFTRVQRLDPFNDYAAYRIARIHLYQQNCETSVAEFRKIRPHDFQFPVALECAGHPQEALASLADLETDRAAGAGAESDAASARAVVYAVHHDRSRAADAIRIAIANESGGSHFHHAMYFIAAAYAQLGDATSALHWLQRTSREGMPCYPLFAHDPLLDPVRSDPRIVAFLDESRREWEERRRQLSQ